MSLGGKITIILAILWGVPLSMLLVLDVNWRMVPDWIETAGYGLFIALAFPFALLGTGIGKMGQPATAEIVRYFIFMIPNLFFLGYSLAGLWHLIRKLTGPVNREFT